MKFLIDMNLSPRWCSILQAEGWDSVHWSDIGIASAPDHEVMQRAFQDQRVILTHDLDYGAATIHHRTRCGCIADCGRGEAARTIAAACQESQELTDAMP